MAKLNYRELKKDKWRAPKWHTERKNIKTPKKPYKKNTPNIFFWLRFILYSRNFLNEHFKPVFRININQNIFWQPPLRLHILEATHLSCNNKFNGILIKRWKWTLLLRLNYRCRDIEAGQYQTACLCLKNTLEAVIG